MPILGGSTNLRKRLEATDAIHQLQEGRPDKFPLQAIQAVINELLKARKIETNLQKCDQFLASEIDHFKGELHIHEVAIISSCHAQSHDRVRDQLISIRPDADTLRELFLWKLKAYVQCLFHCQKAKDSLFLAYESAAIIELLHIVIPARSRELRPVWKLLRIVGDGQVQELFPLTFVEQALLHCGYWSLVNSTLEALQSSRQWSEAWAFVKGIRRATVSPQTQQVLREQMQSYNMWASWDPNEDRIKRWNDPLLSKCRKQLAMILDLEGPDKTGKQHSTLRGALVYQDDAVQCRALQTVTVATHIGTAGVQCLVEFCASNQTLTEDNVELLEAILELGVPGKVAQARGLLRFAREDVPGASVNHRVAILVSALSVIQASPKLQRIFCSKFNLPLRCHDTLKTAQAKFHAELRQGSPNTRLALTISTLARALVAAHRLRGYWTPAYTKMLSQIPSEGELTKRIQELSRVTGSVRERHIAFLIEKLCAGPVAEHSAHVEPQWRPQPEDPIWDASMDLDRERLRQILGGMDWVDKATTTACLRRSGEEDDSFIQELNTIINDDTDQVCVNLARYLGPFAVKTRRLDPCWKRLLMSMMRRRPSGLLDRLGEIQSLQSWQDWLNNLRHIYGEGHLDPEGQLGFTKAKILQWQQRKRSLSRADSDASTATRSTGNFSNAASDSSYQTTLTIPSPNTHSNPLAPPSCEILPELDDQPRVTVAAEAVAGSLQHGHSLRRQSKAPAVRTESVEIIPSVGNRGDIPWYEREIDLLNAFKSSLTIDDKLPKISGGFVSDDDDIYN
ncbi:hypothetical protein HD806DRAFT_507142 [Xylariaceae sp. AK1471]|nr:hypothetical protein HD806DRAFT_507142 [Xylariaceae sp. AK1471]